MILGCLNRFKLARRQPSLDMQKLAWTSWPKMSGLFSSSPGMLFKPLKAYMLAPFKGSKRTPARFCFFVVQRHWLTGIRASGPTKPEKTDLSEADSYLVGCLTICVKPVPFKRSIAEMLLPFYPYP